MVKNQKGWIRIIEALSMVVLLAGLLIVVLNQTSQATDGETDAYNIERKILLGIQLDETLRTDIFGYSLPAEFSDFNGILENKITSETPGFLDCTGRICSYNDDCNSPLSVPSGKDIYSQSVFISGNADSYSPRQLKLFCWKVQ